LSGTLFSNGRQENSPRANFAKIVPTNCWKLQSWPFYNPPL
jgi:hypothetical protein